jgi:hypothetical protein
MALGSRCQWCRLQDPQVLQIDHKHGGGNQERRTFSRTTAYMYHVLAHLHRYQLLCANCNWRKRLRYEPRGRKK